MHNLEQKVQESFQEAILFCILANMSTRRYFLHRRATCWNEDIKGKEGKALTRRTNGTDPIEIWKKLKF